MNDENLIPLAQRSKEDAKRIRSLGGKVAGKLPKYKQTKCRNCRLPCPIKDIATEQDLCKIPDIQRELLEYKTDPEKITHSLVAAIFRLQQKSLSNEKHIKPLIDSLVALKKEVNPASTKVEHSGSLYVGNILKNIDERILNKRKDGK